MDRPPARGLDLAAERVSKAPRSDAEGDDSASAEVDLRDEIEAEIEATELESDDEPKEEKGEEGQEGQEKQPRKRRRRRRGGRGRRRRPGAGMEATLEEDRNGFLLKLEKKLKDDPIYSEHWEGHKDLKLTVEPDPDRARAGERARERAREERAREERRGRGVAGGGPGGVSPPARLSVPRVALPPSRGRHAGAGRRRNR